jgi:hypothetical protein
MAYTNNYVEVLAETGEYESEIINADVRTTTNGTQYLNLAFKLTSLNLVVYDKIWRDFTCPSEFNHKRVAQLLTALNIEDELADDFALIQAIKGKKLIVSVTKEYNDKRQKEENLIKEYKTLSQDSQETTPSVEINEDDLPF